MRAFVLKKKTDTIQSKLDDYNVFQDYFEDNFDPEEYELFFGSPKLKTIEVI